MEEHAPWYVIVFVWICCLIAAGCCHAAPPMRPVLQPEAMTLIESPIPQAIAPGESAQVYFTAYQAPALPPEVVTDALLGVADTVNLLAWGRVKVDPRLSAVSTAMQMNTIDEASATATAATAEWTASEAVAIPMGFSFTNCGVYSNRITSRSKDGWNWDGLDDIHWQGDPVRTQAVTLTTAQVAQTLNLTSVLPEATFKGNYCWVRLESDAPFSLTTSAGVAIASEVTSVTLKHDQLFISDKVGTSWKVTGSVDGQQITLTQQDPFFGGTCAVGDSAIGRLNGQDVSLYAVEGAWRLFHITLTCQHAHADMRKIITATIQMIDETGTLAPYAAAYEFAFGGGSASPGWRGGGGYTHALYFLPAGAAFRIGTGLGAHPQMLNAQNISTETVAHPITLQTFGVKVLRGVLSPRDLRCIFERDKAELQRRELW